ncbi:cytochrome c [Methylomonas paludis]|uniref:Cytochrome c n=1 Tax=Methylomonas paludis TaxID=1173101 RepID=A0A975RAX7_9GAMM|nr:cytochrome c [Methylomonas paludis]QWF71706.1 cytochrome c [Methylomonas paludis]
MSGPERLGLILLLGCSVAVAEPDLARQQELSNLLKHDCGACHGLSRKGGLGPSLLAADLAGKSDEFLVATILQGRKGTAMPPWRSMLSEADALWLVKALRE